TGGSLDPTRSFVPAAAGISFPSYHRIYWADLLPRGAFAVGGYRFVKHSNCEQANPGHDSLYGGE
ncbi:uncharacterized protein M421DRAFT_74529, partial [Didymella exigua CBS 183.55]